MTPSDMARLRWQHTTQAQRTAYARELAIARAASLSKRERVNIARVGGICRALKAGQRLGKAGKS